MAETRIEVSSIVEGQLPSFIREEYPLAAEFLSQYYTSIESQSGPSDIIQNIDKYVKIDALTNLTDSTTLSASITSDATTINVESTAGFPDSYGLIQIDNEIITYTEKTTTSFVGCVRGFSGITSYQDSTLSDRLVFSESQSASHDQDSTVTNLSVLFLKEFYKKVKKQITPGFEDKEFYSGLNESLFIKQSKDFYSSKGTDASIKILFKALYGEDVQIIRPRDYLIQASDSKYEVNRNLVVEKIEGNIEDLVDTTIYQDENDYIDSANAVISKVEKILRGDKEYYVLSVEDDNGLTTTGVIKGSFTIHPKTQLIEDVQIGADVLTVDSTVGFPNSGELVIGNSQVITYTEKSLTQFFGCSGITAPVKSNGAVRANVYAYGMSPSGKTIKFRVTGVLSNLNILKQVGPYEKGDKVYIKTLGYDSKKFEENRWFFNVPVKYDVRSLDLLDITDFTYLVTLYDSHSLSLGDSITFISPSGVESSGFVVSYDTDKSFKVRGQGQLNTNQNYILRKNLLKVNATNYPNLSNYTSDVQNVYTDLDGSFYVASPSIPTYLNQPLNVSDKSITFSGTFSGTDLVIGNNNFFTGDSIVYNPENSNNNLGIITGAYFVKKVNDTTIRIANSLANIDAEKFISIASTTVSNNKFIIKDYTYLDFETRLLEPQKILRKISSPEKSLTKTNTSSGNVGIFINGVEILSYKSKDVVYYGPIEKINVLDGGTNYDVINPPTLDITDENGSGTSVYTSVIGELKRIEILDQGFDYLNNPTIKISGGNGVNASAKANLIQFDHAVTLLPSAASGLINLTTDTIGFTTYHKFRDGEKVIYDPQNGSSVGGLTTNAQYFVSVQSATTIKLHNTFDDVAAGINTVNLTAYGVGTHLLKSVQKKKRIGSITVENPGQNYQNRKTTTTSVGINTASDSINIKNHGYNTGEIVTYTSTGMLVGGLSQTSYYVTKVDDDNFKLSIISPGNVGISTGNDDFYFKTKQYVNLTSTGSGTHIFNYPPITATVDGIIGVTTFAGQDFTAKVQPIFRGSINSIFIENGGTSFGSQEILNYNHQPEFAVSIGSKAQITPVISNGKIAKVVVNNSGSGYTSIPDLEINQLSNSGSGAILTPVIVNGSLVEVRVINGGSGYENNISISVVAAGENAKFEGSIKPWQINLVERGIIADEITDDDGFLSKSFYENFGLQYCHAYAPRKLRSSVVSQNNNEDLGIFNGVELVSTDHSPVIGWAYDGNPIYGPYGYSTATGGSVKALKSGYNLLLKNNRPSLAFYPLGFFIDDFEYTANGDLDEHNGRFCVTPEYPNGVYAYFCTIDISSIQSQGPFKNYFKPQFPYVIGNSYNSNPIQFNFLKTSNQDEIDINETGWMRNITPYNLTKPRSFYEYLSIPNKIKENVSTINSISTGSIDSIGIKTGGQNYKVGDKILFDNSGTGGQGLSADVSLIKGKIVSQVSVATSSIDYIEFSGSNIGFNFIGFSSLPHNFVNNDVVTITGKYDYKKTNPIIVTNNILTTISSIASTTNTGLVTYFSVSGNLNFPNIRENDIYQINNEKVKVLNIDKKSARIRVLRNINNISEVTSYASGIALTESTRKFEISFGISTSYQLQPNKELYFDPAESVGLGTTAGVGIGSTLFFSNPGAGITQITIPTKTIYLPDHKLETGTRLIYNSNGGTPISISTNGIANYQLPNNSTVYVAKISEDLIGIATVKVGLDSTGIFVGLGTIPGNTLYFHSVGVGDTHSFKTDYDGIFTSSVNQNIVTVSTATTHGLLTSDSIVLNAKPGITTTVSVKYDDFNRRMIVNSISFTAPDVDVVNDTIKLSNHGLYNGQKIIHTSSSPCGGLTSEFIYYVVYISENLIKLSNSYYDSTLNTPVEVVNLTSASFGTISPVNPPIKAIRDVILKFDLSDPSLAFVKSGTSYPAFKLNFYEDSEFKNVFDTSKNTSTFEVSRFGKPGVDANAHATIKINDYIPNVLYYRLDPIDLDNNSSTKTEIVVDKQTLNYNKITKVDSLYSGTYVVTVGVGSTTFTFNSVDVPEIASYSSSDGVFEYYTSSTSAFGEIHQVEIKNNGINYSSYPKVKSINSGFGTNAILDVIGQSIGIVKKTTVDDIGFDYYSDLSIRPSANLAHILKISNSSSLKSIGISSVGKDYTIAPNLILIDGLTKKPIEDVELKYNLGDSFVSIIKNTKSISDSIVTIIPINNVNGSGITSISYNNSTKEVTIELAKSFSNISDFPFVVGEKFLIENVSVGVGSTGYGYNSENYDYQLFTVKASTPNIGGIGATVVYSLEDYLPFGEFPGVWQPTSSSSARIISQSHFPIFDVQFEKNNFFKGEDIISNGKVESWDSINNILRISSNDSYEIGDVIRTFSGSQAKIVDIIGNEGIYDVKESQIVKRSWKDNVGFLNDNLQKISDNDYYQYFSYSLKSNVDYDKWDETTNSLSHTAGFKKFGDLLIESSTNEVGLSTTQNDSDVSITVDLQSEIDLDCYYDFDLVSEGSFQIDNTFKSDKISFSNRILSDYTESIGNRVIILDDISSQFNSNPRANPFTIVDTFLLTSARSKKYFYSIVDTFYNAERQVGLIGFIHDDSIGYLNHYGAVYTQNDLGTFDFSISGIEGNLRFYPYKYKVNDYDLSFVSFDIEDTVASVGSTSLGNCVSIAASTVTLASGTSTATTIVGIASTYRSSKVLVQIGATDGSYFEFNELTVLHDGSEVSLLEYFPLATDSQLVFGSVGLGTYIPSISGSNVNIDFKPNSALGVGHTITTFRISVGDTTSSGVGTIILRDTQLDSEIVSIASSISPVANLITSFSNDLYGGAYYFASVEDTTNNQYEVSELVCITDETTAGLSEFGIVRTGSSLGTFSISGTASTTSLNYTPNPNIDVQVRIFRQTIGNNHDASLDNELDLGNTNVVSSFGSYKGTENDIKKQFDLTRNGDLVFQRSFDGSNTGIVSISNNTIRIPSNYFVTGEEVTYSYLGSTLDTENAIGIATTTISGIGLTDKLPTTLYIVKLDELDVRVSASASDALKSIPNVLTLASVGVGTIHKFTAKNQNSKLLITIDNQIMSPAVGNGITESLVSSLGFFDSEVSLSGITSITAGSLIKINDEIMLVNSASIVSNSVIVNRGWAGSGISSHSSGSLVRRLVGDYNIIDSQINFITPPYGQIPFVNLNMRGDEEDYIGLEVSSTFNGRMFMKSGNPDSNSEPYSNNYVFDESVSNQFNSIESNFTLTNDLANVSGFSTSNAVILLNNIFQLPSRSGTFVNVEGNYDLTESAGITTISFIGAGVTSNEDPNTSSLPRGGIIVSVGSTEGFGYQPLVSAGGTAVVSGLGTIQSISIGNSGSGYRSGIQTVVNVGVATTSLGTPNIEFIGTAAISGGHVVSVAITNPGTGYTSTNPPLVIFDDPLSYSNIPLIYSSNSISGVGTEATVDIVVGQGSSVISFEIKNYGYSYNRGEILTVAIGGITGIPTDTSLTFNEFQIAIEDVFFDKFSGWSIGDLQVLDPLDSLFDGVKKVFPLEIDSERFSIKARSGSLIDIKANLLVFINDTLQVPGDGYIFNGGSLIQFTEAPKEGDTSKILFYKGNGDIDTESIDILETVESGDTLQIYNSSFNDSQDERLVKEILSVDEVLTNAYNGPGLTTDSTLVRPVIWCKQRQDMIIDGSYVSKDRIHYEPLIYPLTNIIQNVGTSSTTIWVSNIKTFFDNNSEYYASESTPRKIAIISQDTLSGAAATAVVSIAGTIQSIVVNDGGVGYTTNPIVSIATPDGLNTTYRAEASATITGGEVTSINITSPGSGYTMSNPPVVLVESPNPTYETITNVTYDGDFGIITGIAATSIVGIATTGLVFDLFIPENSFLRNIGINSVGIATTGISGIQTGDYFTVFNSNVGNGVTSLSSSNTGTVGIGTSFIDNIYKVAQVSIAQTSVPGIALTFVTRVVVSVASTNEITGFGYSSFYGEYSWGRITGGVRNNPKSFTAYNNGLVGISTSPVVQRYNPLKYQNYYT
jgi:hypothetical protein